MPKIVDHAHMRDGLVDGCVRLFADRGYASLTMREVAAALGVSTGTLYHYFPGKDALFDAVVRAVAAQDLGAVADYADLPADPGIAIWVGALEKLPFLASLLTLGLPQAATFHLVRQPEQRAGITAVLLVASLLLGAVVALAGIAVLAFEFRTRIAVALVTALALAAGYRYRLFQGLSPKGVVVRASAPIERKMPS